MAKAAEHGLRTTPGSFQMRGVVTGTRNTQNFYSEKTFENGNKMRAVNFGVKYDTDKAIYPTIQGFTRSDVYFGKRNKETKKTDTQKVSWAQRMSFAEQNPGWNIIGMNVGLVKGEDGKNVVQHLTEYDAAQYIKENLKDDVSVFVKGNLDFRSYTDTKNNEVKRFHNFTATQVSLCADVDFNAEDFDPMHEWTQEIVYTGIDRETDAEGKQTGRFILSGYVVAYNSIEPVSFIVTNAKFAQNIRKKLKPYNSIQCHGKIEVTHIIEEVTTGTTDDWGDENKMKRANAPSIRELICTGASPDTIDEESFTEESVAEGIKKLKAKEKVSQKFGEKKEEAKAAVNNDDDWGDSASSDDDEDTPW